MAKNLDCPGKKLDNGHPNYTQRIWAKVQKLGLTQSYHENNEKSRYVKQLMALPFLPASLINPTFLFFQVPDLSATQTIKMDKLVKYFKRRWLHQITPEELSIYGAKAATNNGAESYHAKLKSIIKIPHPRIWNFMTTLNDINHIIADTDNEIGRLRLGKDISRQRKKKNVIVEERRESCKENLRSGTYTPWQYLQAVSNTVGSVVTAETEFSDIDSESENDVTEKKIRIICAWFVWQFVQKLGYSCHADTLTVARLAAKE